jgi:hypothetical protein
MMQGRFAFIFALLALLATACGDGDSQQRLCERLCEKQLSCDKSFAFKVCTDWCETFEDDDNDRVLHPKMIDCLSIEDCEGFALCIVEAAPYLDGTRPNLIPDSKQETP